MRRFRILRVSVGLALGVLGMTTAVAAQTNDEIFPQLQWNFSTPGARANGMGRSFIGVADDATAAVTNPAGLLNLTRPQVYAEYKNTKLKVDRLAAADSLVSLQPTTFESTIDALSFLSVSAPIGGKIAVGFSVHRFLDHHETFTLAPRRVPNLSSAVLFPVAGSVDFTATSFGGSVAYQVIPALRLGLTVAGNRFEPDAVGTRYLFTNDLKTSSVVVNQTSIQKSDVSISAALGVLYKPTDKLTVGFTYAKSPRFNTQEDAQYNPGLVLNADLTTFNLDRSTNLPLAGFTTLANPYPRPVAIDVPDRFGVGVSIRPMSRLLFAADIVRIQYSSLSKNTTIVLEGATTTLTGSQFDTPDVTETHVGAEYNFYDLMGKFPLFVRGGVFTNPNHLTRFTGSDATAAAVFNLLPDKDETRGTVGAGVVFGTRFQVDAAYVFGKEFVASTGVRF